MHECLDNTFFFTYGDGVTDVDINALVAHHRAQGKQATLTAVQTPGRYGVIGLDEYQMAQFHEKPDGDGCWINGGYFVLEPAALDLLDGDSCTWKVKNSINWRAAAN